MLFIQKEKVFVKLAKETSEDFSMERCRVLIEKAIGRSQYDIVILSVLLWILPWVIAKQKATELIVALARFMQISRVTTRVSSK
ncbi:hypothetical protein D5F52_00540 [Brevibacillus laterosporus]|nr:hypothetical protein D5F52_00540 [Brevibacillus laterosporus]